MTPEERFTDAIAESYWSLVRKDPNLDWAWCKENMPDYATLLNEMANRTVREAGRQSAVSVR